MFKKTKPFLTSNTPCALWLVLSSLFLPVSFAMDDDNECVEVDTYIKSFYTIPEWVRGHMYEENYLNGIRSEATNKVRSRKVYIATDVLRFAGVSSDCSSNFVTYYAWVNKAVSPYKNAEEYIFDEMIEGKDQNKIISDTNFIASNLYVICCMRTKDIEDFLELIVSGDAPEEIKKDASYLLTDIYREMSVYYSYDEKYKLIHKAGNRDKLIKM